MADIEPRKWEIWHAKFKFEEGKGYKYRPVIVVGSQRGIMEAMMVTGCGNKLRMPHDHILIDWEAAGLDKPSIARVDRVAKLPLNYVGSAGRIGKLSQANRAAISRLLKAKAKDALRARQAVPPVE